MPYGNGMGPNGMGPMTGRGAGYCAGGAGFASGGNRGSGRGLGRGRGFSRGFGFGQGNLQSPLATNPSIIKQNLERQAELMEAQLGAIRGRLASINDGELNKDEVDK